MENESKNITNSLAHTKWNCKYHIVFAPKYRRKVFFEEKRAEIREILRKLCAWKGVEIIEGEICPDHVHMLVSIPPKMSVSGFKGYLKGKSSLMIFRKWENMKLHTGTGNFGGNAISFMDLAGDQSVYHKRISAVESGRTEAT